MPYVCINAARNLSDAQLSVLRRDIADAMSILPGKNAENTMLQINAGCDIHMGGAPAEAAFVDCRLFMPSPEAEKAAWNDRVCAILKEHAGVKVVYVNFVELEHWGTQAGYR